MVAGLWLGARVAHNRRGRPGFEYRVRYLCLPLGGIEDACAGLGLLSLNRFNAFSLRFRDYGAQRADVSPREWIEERKREAGVADAADGETWLLTVPRTLGYAFNPVSFWLCLDREERLRAVLCEVRNTFGERHCYWVCRDDRAPLGPSDPLICAKRFHVSPFLPLRGRYLMRFAWRPAGSDGGRRLNIWIQWRDSESGLGLNTSVRGRLEPLTAGALRRWLLAAPLNAAAIVWRIHWQALLLWLRRAQFFRKPEPPAEAISPPQGAAGGGE